MHTLTEENYLKTIHRLSFNGEVVTTNDLAHHLQTMAPSVTDMLKKLKQKKLISYKKYYGVSLTDEGRKTALGIIRRHRLWEAFLVKVLGYGWDEVHDAAEHLEHIRTPELVERIDKYLGYPRFDPHGNPIPDSNGRYIHQQLKTLGEIKEKEKAVVESVTNDSSSFLKYLDKLGVSIGTKLFLVEKNSYDHSLDILINQKKKAHISNEIASNILVSTEK